jgi:ABC-2 type transport system permease protein
VYAFKPAATLALVDRGVDPYVGVFAWLEAHKQNDFKYRPAQDATALERMGAWTAAGVLQLLLPLLIVMLCFPAFAGERESGTLRQLLSTGVTPRTLALGKALGVAGALAVLLVPAAVLGTWALTLTSGAASGPDGLTRSLALTLSYLAYFAGFVGIALATSATASTARGALLALLAFWSINSFVAPRAASDIARRVHPAPSALAFNRAVERELIMHGDAQQALEDSVKRAHGVTSLDSLPVNFAAISLQAGEEHGYKVFDQHYGALDATFASQERVQNAFGVAAPLLAVRAASMALAGTDREHHRHFAAAAEHYRRRLVELMNNSLLPVNASSDAFGVMADSTLWSQLPDFTYAPPTFSWVLVRQRLSLGALALWVLLGLGLAILATRRIGPESPGSPA